MATLSTDELKRRFERAVRQLGGAYDVEDIINRVNDGTMQSWQSGQSVVVTEVLSFPRKKIVNVVLVAGNIEEIMALQDEVAAWAKEIGCSKMITSGRRGLSTVLPKYGWSNGRCIYELNLEA